MDCRRLVLLVQLSFVLAIAGAQVRGQGLFTLEEVAPSTCTNRTPRILQAADGVQHVVYYYDNVSGGRGKMKYIKRAPGSPWDSQTASEIADSASHVTAIAVDPTGTPFITYSNGADESERLRWQSASNWTDLGQPLASGSF